MKDHQTPSCSRPGPYTPFISHMLWLYSDSQLDWTETPYMANELCSSILTDFRIRVRFWPILGTFEIGQNRTLQFIGQNWETHSWQCSTMAGTLTGVPSISRMHMCTTCEWIKQMKWPSFPQFSAFIREWHFLSEGQYWPSVTWIQMRWVQHSRL